MEEKILYLPLKKKWYEIRYRQSNGKVLTLPNIYFINEKGVLTQYWNKKGGQ